MPEAGPASVKRLNILFLAAWYPTREQTYAGVFVRQCAKAVGLYNDVVVLHCMGEDSSLRGLWRCERDLDDRLTEGITTYRFWYRKCAFPMSHAFLYVWSAIQTYRLVVRSGFRADAIHAHVYDAGFPAAVIGRLYRKPVVVTECSSSFSEGKLPLLRAWKARLVFRSASFVLPVSRALQQCIERYRVNARFHVVPLAVDLTIFHPPAVRAPSIQKRLLFVGSQIPVKGVIYLLEALARLRTVRTDWRLDVVGDGAQRARYERMAVDLGLAASVTFHGAKSSAEVAEFMRRCDALVLPSLWESLPCVLMEAMVTGTPVIASDVGGIPELVTPDAGILVTPGDSADLFNALSGFLSGQWRADGGKIAKRAARLFSLESVGRELDDVYRVCLTS